MKTTNKRTRHAAADSTLHPPPPPPHLGLVAAQASAAT